MFLRELTDEELENIKKFKDSANVIIKMQRRGLAAKIKVSQKAFHIHQAEILIKELDNLKVVTGHPVIVKDRYDVIYLNYDLVNKCGRSLDKGNFYSQWSEIKENHLAVRYEKHGQSGTLDLYQLPAHQVDLLDGLPIVNL